MGYLSELTAHERLTVDNATIDIFAAFENGSGLIYEVWERYFSDRVQKEIESRELAFIGQILWAAYDLIGHYDEPGVESFLETAKRAQLTADAVKAREHAQEEMRSATYDLDDADAIKLLTGKEVSA